MAGEQTPEQEAAALQVLRDKALASREAAEQAQAALVAADPTSATAEPPAAPVAPTGEIITQSSLEAMLAKAIESTTSGLKDSIVAVTRENTAIKATQIRLEAQRLRVCDIGKTEGKTVSLAKQLEFTEDTIDTLENLKVLALGIVLDNPAAPVPPAGPTSPSKLVCKLADSKDGSLLLNQLDTLIASVKAKLKELTIIWGAPSYRVAFEAIGANAHSQGAVAEEAMKEISDAVARVETQAKAKRKEEVAGGWGQAPAKQAKSDGGWGQPPSQDSRDWGGSQARPDWQDNQLPARSYGKGGQGKGGQGKGKGKAPYPPAGNPPASFGGSAAPAPRVGRPGPNQCAYCWKEGHYKDTCPELAAQNAKWNSGW